MENDQNTPPILAPSLLQTDVPPEVSPVASLFDENNNLEESSPETENAIAKEEQTNTAEKKSSPYKALELNFFPENLRKHIDPASPLPVRLMAAKGMLPLAPLELVHVIYQAQFDSEKKIRSSAKKSFKGLDERILKLVISSADLHPMTAALFCRSLLSNSAMLELILLNKITPTWAFHNVAKQCEDATILTLIINNQGRLQKDPELVRSLYQNPALSRSELNRAIDFLVRQGIFLDDIPEFADAMSRLGKEDLKKAIESIVLPDDLFSLDEQKSAAALGLNPEEFVLKQHQQVEGEEENKEGEEIQDSQKQEDDSKKQEVKPESQRAKPLSTYPIPVQIKLAMMGNRTLAMEAVGSTNRMIAEAGIRNPRIKDSDVLRICRMKSLCDGVVRYLSTNKEWTKSYQVKFLLIQNPKTPLALALRWVNLLRLTDLKQLSKSKAVPSAVRIHAKKKMSKK